MKRTEKWPETETFHYYNANPHHRITGDCRIRAICTACEVSYNRVVMDLARIQCETGYDQCTNQGISILLKEYGWVKHPMPRKANNKRYTAKEFCEVIAEKDKRYFVSLANHDIAIVENKVWDIWDSTGKYVGNYWTKSV